jgi:hypothetical protein
MRILLSGLAALLISGAMQIFRGWLGQAAHLRKNVMPLELRQGQTHIGIECQLLVFAGRGSKEYLVDVAVYIISAYVPIFITVLSPFAANETGIRSTNRIGGKGR